LVSCDQYNFGCDGGYLKLAWTYMYNTGVVSDDCVPYSSGLGRVEACPTTCTGSGTWRKYKCSDKAVKASGVAAIKSEIYANGPVETGFTVYADFMSYSSGVY
jgi:cathepsin B